MAFILFTVGLTTSSHSALADFKVTAAQNPFTSLFGLKTDFDQVRIDQRVVIRLPSQPAPPAAVGAKRQSLAKVEYKEKKIGKCLWLDRLGGSRPGPDRTLELLTREGILIRAYLREGCLAREFYAGAYMERSYDGKLCVDRDMLHARTGAKCQIDKFRSLIPR